MARPRKPKTPFYRFNSSPEVIRLVVLMCVRFPLSLRNVEDLLFERGIDISHETVRYWWNRFGPMFAAEIRRKRSAQSRLMMGSEEGWNYLSGALAVGRQRRLRTLRTHPSIVPVGTPICRGRTR
jgi:transposase-like protein